MEMMGSLDERRRGEGGGRVEVKEGDRWRGKVVVEGMRGGKRGVRRGEGSETGISGSEAFLA